jgi:hypothetical protein
VSVKGADPTGSAPFLCADFCGSGSVATVELRGQGLDEQSPNGPCHGVVILCGWTRIRRGGQPACATTGKITVMSPQRPHAPRPSGGSSPRSARRNTRPSSGQVPSAGPNSRGTATGAPRQPRAGSSTGTPRNAQPKAPRRGEGKNDSARKWRVRYSTPSPETRGGSRNPQPGYRKRFGIRGWSTTQPKLWSTTDHHSTCGCSCADIGNLRGHRDTRAA